jgi:hypothetical protein
MKRALRFWVAVPGLLCWSAALAASYPTADQLRAAIVEVAAMVKPEKLELEILDAQKEGLTQPLMGAGLSLDDGVCVVYYNAKPEGGLIQFFETLPAQDMPVWLNSIAVHEVTHCIEQREAYIRGHFDTVLPPGISRDHLTVQGYLAVVHSGAVETWGEALADIASVLYFRQAVPERWEQFANSLAGMRSNLAGKWPEHDTSAWLHKMIAAHADKPANQSLFQAAFQLRRQYRPDSDTPAGPATVQR